MTTRVLFVCLGNICRSPTAEGVFRSLVSDDDDIEAESAGTAAYHTGNPPDERAIAAAAERGIDLSGLRARQVEAADFDRFDLILAMDRSNLTALHRLAPAKGRAEVRLMLSYGDGGDVPDPYYEGGFPQVFDLLTQACTGLLTELRGRR